MFTKDQFLETFEELRKYVDQSQVRYSKWLSDILEAEIYLKLECLNPGRSFKIRGAISSLLAREKMPNMVITASGGNHGLGVAIAAKNFNLPCKVVLPKTTSKYRIELLEQLGAEVELYGEAWDEANEYALKLAQTNDILYIHPFADKTVMMGQGTISLELLEQVDDFDLVMASVGGGGLLGGIALAFEALNEEKEIYAVETRGADSLAQSLKKDELIELDAITSIAKTLGAKKTTQYIFETMKRLVDRMFVVDDREAVKAILQFLDHEKILVEPATACIIAAALDNAEYFQNKKCVFVICGSNVTYGEVIKWQKKFKVEYP